MTLAEILEILESILATTASHTVRDRRSIRNERYFHHMFSYLVTGKLGGDACWRDLKLHPEHATTLRFRRKKISVYDYRVTAAEGVGNGRRGNIDFMIAGEPRLLVEWKGPNIYSEKELLEVFLKLLTEPEQDFKVIAAIFTSSEIDRADHKITIIERFNKYLNLAKQVLHEKSLTSDLSRLNLHALIASIPSAGPQKIHWGPVSGDLPLS